MSRNLVLVLSDLDIKYWLNITEALTGKPNKKYTTFNEEPSHDNNGVPAFNLIPPTNGAEEFNDIGG